MNNISFQSKIRACNTNDFYSATRMFRNNSVNYPWTIKESLFETSAYTKDVEDCTVLGITNGLKVLLLHICPTIKENLNFSKIEEFILNKININNPDLQGFLLGSKNGNESKGVFKFLESLLTKYKIPYSKFENCNGVFDVAYSSQNDEWIIGCKNFKESDTTEKFLQDNFSEVKISEYDEFDN